MSVMKAARHRSSWADLQPELLGLVLRRLNSLADRVRLAAVCRPWRDNARLEPVPPPFPWLTLCDGSFLSIPDLKIHRLPLPPAPQPISRCHDSVGNWLFLEHRHSGGVRSMSLVNAFSKDVVQLPDADTIWRQDQYPYGTMLYKLLSLSSMDPSSPGFLFALLIAESGLSSVMAVCKPSAASALPVPNHEGIFDVELFDGKLYALSQMKLFVVEVDSSDDKRKPKIASFKCVADVRNPGMMFKTVAGKEFKCIYWSYLAESRGKLLHVRRLIGYLSSVPNEDRLEQSRTISFEVYEIDLTTYSSAQWRRLDSLGGGALFVGPHSKLLQASECGAKADCIYFIRDYDRQPGIAEDPLRDYGVFNMIDGTITPLLLKTVVPQIKGTTANVRPAEKSHSARLSWFFPS